jgi:hypothetical protein
MAIAIDANELDRRVAEGVFKAYEAERYTEVGEDGQKKYSSTKLSNKLLEYALGAELEKEQEIGAKGVERDTLMRRTFPSLPEPDPDDDVFEFRVAKEVRKEVGKEVARLMQTGRRGVVAKKVIAHEKRGLVLMKDEVGDNKTVVWFVSTNVGLIDMYWATPRTDRVKSVSTEAAREFAWVAEHNKAAKKMLNEKMDDGMEQATEAAKTVLQLAAGGRGGSDS